MGSEHHQAQGRLPARERSTLASPSSRTLALADTLLVTGAAAQMPELRRAQLITAQQEDNELSPLCEEAFSRLEDPKDLTRDSYLFEEGLLYKVSRGPDELAHILHEVVVVSRKLQAHVLQLAHDGLGGHFGVNRTAPALEVRFYWPGWRRSVKSYVAPCPPCQLAGRPNEVVPRAPLQKIPSVSVPFQDVVIDYTPEGRKKQKSRNAHVLTIIDQFTRYPEAIPARSTSSKNAIKALIHFCRFGFPATIQSDEGRHFMSKELRDSLASHGITHHYSTPYHPECQGIIERFHQTLGSWLSILAEENGASWEENLPYALFSISFEVGDQVLVLRLGASQPLETQFTGPHKILAWKGQLNYLVDCGRRLAKWLHINLLKAYQERALSSRSDGQAFPHQRTGPQVTKDELGCTSQAEHTITLQESTCPIAQGYYKVNPSWAERIQAQIQLQLDLGLIERFRNPWSSQVVLVPKEWGGNQLCINVRKLNAVTKPEPYPLPRIKICLDSLGQAPYLSKIDLEKTYWQVPLSAESRPLMAFLTPSRHYQCRVMPFSLKNAPSCFQRLMNEVFARIPNCVLYLDDIVVYTNTWDEHLRILAKVFEALHRANLVVNLKKCQFGVAEITCLGYVLGSGWLMPKDANIQAIREMPYPTTKDAQRFLEMVQYFRWFIPNLSDAAIPITNLFKGNKEF
ncbi:uncharacterized protein [Macrobrachium rosenbergii]|uniref:uncharacterized protein n=1 Tax=Macrobrachium rosenbergii TaxID=79674 RepID=UPI0034D62D51